MAILPTDDSTTVLVCAADSALGDIRDSYDNFVKVCRTTRREPPKLELKNASDPAVLMTSPAATRALLHTLRREIIRLEDRDCTWRPRRYFAPRLREIEQLTHAKCVAFEGEEAPEALPPGPYSTRPNKRTRTETGEQPNPDTTQVQEPAQDTAELTDSMDVSADTTTVIATAPATAHNELRY